MGVPTPYPASPPKDLDILLKSYAHVNHYATLMVWSSEQHGGTVCGSVQGGDGGGAALYVDDAF